MLFWKKRRPFETYQPVRFKLTKVDIFVVTLVVVVFTWAFFIDSFHPMLDENNETIIVETDRGFYTVPRINLQVFIAPLIMVYEMVVLIVLDGKLKGREIPWKFYYYSVLVRLQDHYKKSMEEYKNRKL